jgi:hypothetical protein
MRMRTPTLIAVAALAVGVAGSEAAVALAAGRVGYTTGVIYSGKGHVTITHETVNAHNVAISTPTLHLENASLAFVTSSDGNTLDNLTISKPLGCNFNVPGTLSLTSGGLGVGTVTTSIGSGFRMVYTHKSVAGGKLSVTITASSSGPAGGPMRFAVSRTLASGSRCTSAVAFTVSTSSSAPGY